MGIFKDIDAYTITLTGAQLEGRGKVSLLFFKIEKSVLIWERKALCQPSVKFSIQNVVLRVSWRKTPKCFAAGPLFLVFLMKCLSKYWSTPVPQPPLPPCLDKFMAANLHQGIILFAKRSILNVWQCSEYVSVSLTAQ